MNDAGLAEAGRQAARKVWNQGVQARIEDPLRPAFAEAAVAEFARLQSEATPGIYRDVLEGAARGAEQLDVEPFHGVVEVLQNADDAGAGNLRIAVRMKGRRRCLCFVHDGDPIRLPDLIAMALAFVSTKGDEAFKKGRFGIGLKTLRALGSTLRVHCGPYHVSISLTKNELSACEPTPALKGLFSPGSGETLLELDLDSSFEGREFRSWLESLDVSSLLFLDSVRTVSLAAARSVKPSVVLSLRVSPPTEFEVKLGRSVLDCTEVELKSDDGRAWHRYTVSRPVPRSAPRRRHKKTAALTPLGIAVPSHEAEGEGRIFAGLPLATPVRWPFSVNAQFDVDTPRTGMHRGEWNKWLLGRVAEMIVAIASHRFKRAPASGWAAIPLTAEIEDVPGEWLRGELELAIKSISDRVFRGLRFGIDGNQVRPQGLIYEAKELERLLSPQDLLLLDLDGVPLPKGHRDGGGRWRVVLGERGEAHCVQLPVALTLLDLSDEELGKRTVNWFIRFARIAISGGEGEGLRMLRSIVLNDGSRVTPPAPGAEGEVLVRQTRKASLAHRLGLARVIHRAYLSKSPEALAVHRWLQGNDILATAAGDAATLRALAHRGVSKEGVIDISDQNLRDLRAALMRIEKGERTELGPGIGAAIGVKGFTWVKGRKAEQQVTPAASYLPKTLADRADGWAVAAGHTPDVAYVSARYANVLRRDSGKTGEPGAAGFLRLLGCEVAPHLTEPQEVDHVRGAAANPLDFARLTRSQRAELDDKYVTHTQGDHFSLDLKCVVEDIGRDRSKQRREMRGRALILTFEREWDRLFADKVEATAVFSSHGWYEQARIPASWLAVALDTRWLNDARGRAARPRDLVVRTPATEAMYGSGHDAYAPAIGPSLATSPCVRALGIATDPRVSEILNKLAEMRSEGDAPSAAELDARYLALDGAVRKVDASPDDLVGDISVRALRARFGANRRKPGLIFSGGWRRPQEVFRGPPVFGTRRSFVPESKRAGRLWRLLNVPLPDIEACISVLDEIATGRPVEADEEVLCNVYAHLESLLKEATPKSLAKLTAIPLWTGDGWTRKRPVFALGDETLARSLAGRIPLWRPPLAPESVGGLIPYLGVQVIGEDCFEALVDAGDCRAGGPYRETFVEAVMALRDDLARNDRDLYRKITVPWDDLAKAEIALAQGLEVKLRLPRRKPLNVSASAHLAMDPLRLSCSDTSEIGARASGGRAIASLFPAEDRHKAAMAWAAAWAEAEQGRERGRVALAEEPAETPVEDLYRQAAGSTKGSARKGARAKKGAKPEAPRSSPHRAPPVRRLKSAGDLIVTSVERPDGTVRSRSRRKRGLRKELPAGRPIEETPPAPPSAPKAFSSEQQQHLALIALNQAINGELSDLRDFQHLRGVGADALDRLSRFFEIKSTAGPMKDQVALTLNEYRRALEQGGKFFLAMVAGLEVGYETVVRIIPDPSRSLEASRSQELTLYGVLAVDKPIEIRFGPAESDGEEKG